MLTLDAILRLFENSKCAIVIQDADPDLIAEVVVKGAKITRSTDLQSIGSEYIYRLQYKDTEIVLWSRYKYSPEDIKKAAYIGIRFSDWLRR